MENSSERPRLADDPAGSKVSLPRELWWPTGSFLVLLGFSGLAFIRRRRNGCESSADPLTANDTGLAEQPRERIFVKRQQILSILSANMDDLLHSHVEVRHLISDHMTTIAPTATVAEVKERMRA